MKKNMRKIRILMVEDETDVLSLNTRHLESQGYEVIGAKTLAEAQNSIWEHPPDLVLLDVMLPDGCGYDFCVKLRSFTTAPIIYLTCQAEEGDIIRGLVAGGDDYIVKPYSLDMLSARIMAQLRRAGFSSAGRLEIPPLNIDLTTGKVTLYGREILLSQKESRLLAFLAENAGRAFSAEELYARLWDDGGEIRTNTVRVHISNLRSKLHLDDSSPFELSLTADKRYMFQKVSFGAEG